MTNSGAIHLCVMASLSLLPLGCHAVRGDQDAGGGPVSQLTPADEQLARELAAEELALPEYGIEPGEKMYAVRVQLLPGSTAETTGKEVVVTHYRYRGNQAILTTIDLPSRTVLKVEREVNFPTPLAPEEVRLALELVRADARLADLFAEYGGDLHLETRPVWPRRVEDPAAPHRDVAVLFRVGRHYLDGPQVVVDLVNERVRVEEIF